MASLDPRDAGAVAAGSGLRLVATNGGQGCGLTIALIDQETGESLPGLVRITTSGGGIVPLPGVINRGIGLRTNHASKAWHVLRGSTRVAVPRAAVTIDAVYGIEHEMARRTIDLSGSAEARVEMRLKRFSNVAGKGWFGGNTHLHLHSITRAEADAYLREVPRADGLDMVFVSYLERAKMNPRYVSNEYVLHELEKLGGEEVCFGNGEEHRHNFGVNSEGYGHVMFLNIRELVRPVSIGAGIMGAGPDWPPLRSGIELIRDQGATVIWCHGTLGHEDVPNWLGGLIDAQNIFDGGSVGDYERAYYRYLNAGLKVPFSAGTDWFINDFSRAYARVDGDLTAPRWLEALKAGRTFISNGPILSLQIGDRLPGDTVKMNERGTLDIVGQAAGRNDFGDLELVYNGKVIRRINAGEVAKHFEAELSHSAMVEESGWLALRVSGGRGGAPGGNRAVNELGEPLFAHTSPIYVEVAGKGIFQRDAAESLIEAMESALAKIPAAAVFDDEAQREEVLGLYREGIAKLRGRIGK